MLRKLLALAGAALAAACTSTDAPVEVAADTTTLAPKILNGVPSTDAQNAVVMLYWLDTANDRLGGLCTATLVAPNLILTARHCVAETNQDVACDSNGTPLIGGNVGASHNPQDLYVFTGVNRPAYAGDAPPDLDTTKWQPAGRGAQIIDDGSTTLCNHDIALVELQAPITNTPIASMQLDGQPAVGEKLLTVGWGVSTTEIEPTQRQQRPNVNVKRVGPSDLSPVLTPSEFLFDESICEGDSGGPIFVQSTNAILGVVSRGGNGNDPSGGGPAYTCTNADNLGTKLSPFKTFILDAFKTAGATPKITAAPESDDSGCEFAPPGARSRTGALGVVFVALTLLARRARGGRASAS